MRRRTSAPRVGIRDVARAAGVSQSSVSRVLSEAPFVSVALRERVQGAVAALGYRPDHLARSLRSQVSRSIGFVVGDISNPLISQIVSGAEQRLRGHGYSVLLADSEGRPDLDRAHIELFAQRRVDGLLLSLCGERHDPTFDALRRAALPCVFVDREPRRGVSDGAVLVDHRQGLAPAIEHLLDLGHRRIGFVGGASVRPTLERVRALEQCYAARGLPADYRIATDSFAAAHGARATRALLDAAPRCTALVFGGNHLLVGGLCEIEHAGLAIPRDLSVVSCDESDVTRVYRPRLACVQRDPGALGARAADMLLEILAGARGPRRVSLPTRFSAGASCAPPAR